MGVMELGLSLIHIFVMMRMVAAIARSKRPIERERLPSINRCPAIFILSGLEITDLIKR